LQHLLSDAAARTNTPKPTKEQTELLETDQFHKATSIEAN
jgi:hypothetical protein